MPLPDEVRVRHMIEAIESAQRFVANRIRLDLDADEQLRFALVRAIEIVGEAASKVSPERRAQAPQIAWSSIIGMRNRIVHAYFDVDLEILWTTVTESLPQLRLQLESIQVAD